MTNATNALASARFVLGSSVVAEELNSFVADQARLDASVSRIDALIAKGKAEKAAQRKAKRAAR